MNGTLILTLFDETCPCWTKEMLLKEGVSDFGEIKLPWSVGHRENLMAPLHF